MIDTQLLASRDLIFGGGARTEIRVSSSFFLRFDALAHYAELSRPTGAIALTMPSLSSALGVSFGTAWLEPRLSLGARAGYAWLSGVAGSTATTGAREEHGLSARVPALRDGDQRQGAWAGPELAVELSAWPRARVHPLLSFSVGAHIFGVRGTVDGGRDVLATGVWSSLSLGVAVR